MLHGSWAGPATVNTTLTVYLSVILARYLWQSLVAFHHIVFCVGPRAPAFVGPVLDYWDFVDCLDIRRSYLQLDIALSHSYSRPFDPFQLATITHHGYNYSRNGFRPASAVRVCRCWHLRKHANVSGIVQTTVNGQQETDSVSS